MRTAVFTIISPNYRHTARVLMASLQRNQPEWDRFVLVVGGNQIADPHLSDANADGEPFITVPLDSLPLPAFRQFCFRYTLLELNTAVKPWMFEHVFARGYDRVLYFDPDIFVYSALPELDAAAADNFLTLTPHLTGSIPGDDHPSERTILLAGTYNLGFLAVSRRPQLTQFLEWWQRKLEHSCVVDPAHGLFVDQKWMDLTPGLFDNVAVLRHDGYNVAYWNLAQRSVTGSGAGTRVNGQPLRFFHFSGFNPAFSEMISNHDPRQTVSGAGDAGKLFEDYAAALEATGFRSFRNAPYSYSVFSDGSLIPDAARVAYRDSVELQTAAGADPFEHPELFRGLRDGARTTLTAKAFLHAYRVLSRARPLVGLLPSHRRQAIREFLLGRPDPHPAATRKGTSLPPGLNVVGYLTRDTGVGESARLCANSCEAVGLADQIIDIDNADALPLRASYRASIFHVNADQIASVHQRIPQVFDEGSYNIGCWHWELPELPDAWTPAAKPLDEIWAPSAFVQSAVAAKMTIPVMHMPHGIEVTAIEPCSPEDLGVPKGKFVFLCMFDFDSVVERKNPFAAIDAFHRAFPDASCGALLVKTVNGDRYPADHAALANRLREIPNAYLADRMLPRARVNGLLASSGAVVSLHRSEGFGLILAEAMVLGKPVIATGWSGNMDFMNCGNSCPTAYELVTLDRAYGDYAAGQQWAEPDLDHAAHLMRRVVDDSAYRIQIGERARETIRSRFSPEAAGLRYRQRLQFLGLLEPSSN
jgi:glycosyltransferase involved in cell wall biosynthesis